MQQQYTELVDWISQKKKMTDSICESMDLIDNGVLDSLSFAEYIMMIEDLSGIEIEVTDDLLDKVRTLTLVKHNFFQVQQAQ